MKSANKITEGVKVKFKKLGKVYEGLVVGFHPRIPNIARVEYIVTNSKHGDRKNETCIPFDTLKLA